MDGRGLAHPVGLLDHGNANYGSTPVDPEDRAAFVDGFAVGTKAELDQAEIEALDATYAAYLLAVERGAIGAHYLVSWEVVIDLHGASLSQIWQWAGQIRTTELSIGIDPAYIYEELGKLSGDLSGWLEHEYFGAHEIALRAHHRLTQIHPFTDVNGRITRLYADLLLASLTEQPTCVVDWAPANVDKHAYIAALQHADQAAGDVRALMRLLPMKPIRDA